MTDLGRDALVLTDAPMPRPGPTEVVVEVSAVSLNGRDGLVIETGRGLSLDFPFTPGSDLAGTVVETGSDASRFRVGDRVISTFTPDWRDGRRGGDARTPSYRTLGGFYPGVLAEYVCLPQEWLVRAPAMVSLAEASTLPCAGLTAWFALVERGSVTDGDVVLVEGTGGVSCFAVSIAKARGARVIVSGSADKLARATALGADDVIDRRRPDWVEAVYQLTADRGVDHVLEVVGGSHLARAVEVTAVGGRVSLIGALAGFEVSAPVMPILLKDVVIQGIGTGHRLALERLVDAIDASDTAGVTPVIDRRYPLAELPAALDHLDAGPFGKVVIDVLDPATDPRE